MKKKLLNSFITIAVLLVAMQTNNTHAQEYSTGPLLTPAEATARADRSSRHDLVKNKDGSVDLYFGPGHAPAGMENNFVKTIPGEGFFVYFRLYAPTEPYFEKSWRLPDLEKVK